MHKYRKAAGVVLKKQNYKETDQIVTIWSNEFGKIRVLAKALRSAKSKLAGSLQDLSLVRFEVTGKMPIIISCQVEKNFKGIRSNLAKMAPAFYAAELMLKSTADEHPNEEAFGHLVDFLDLLDYEDDLSAINIALSSFTLKLLSSLGFSTEYASSNFNISDELQDVISDLRRKEFSELKEFAIPGGLTFKLKSTINLLLEYVLEREIKSTAFLAQLK